MWVREPNPILYSVTIVKKVFYMNIFINLLGYLFEYLDQSNELQLERHKRRRNFLSWEHRWYPEPILGPREPDPQTPWLHCRDVPLILHAIHRRQGKGCQAWRDPPHYQNWNGICERKQNHFIKANKIISWQLRLLI